MASTLIRALSRSSGTVPFALTDIDLQNFSVVPAGPYPSAGAQGTGRALSSVLGSVVDVRNFSTLANPYRQGSDDSVPIAAAISYAAGLGGNVTIFLGDGPLTLKSPLTIASSGIKLLGTGKSSTLATVGYNMSSDLITFTGGSGGINYCGLSGIGLVQGGTPTGNYACIRVSNVHEARLEDFQTYGNFYDHVAIMGGSAQFLTYITRFAMGLTTGTNAGIVLGPDGSFPQDTFISDGCVGGNNQGTNGILAMSAGGIYMHDLDLLQCASHGFSAYPSDGYKVVGPMATNVLCDTAGGDCWYFARSNTTGLIASVQLSNCWGSNSQGGNGFNFLPGINGGSLGTCHAVNNYASGFAVTSAGVANLDFGTCAALYNSTQGSGVKPGFFIYGTTSRVSMIGCRSGLGGNATSGNNQSYGFDIDAPTDYITMVGCQAPGNVTGALYNNSTGTHNAITAPI